MEGERGGGCASMRMPACAHCQQPVSAGCACQAKFSQCTTNGGCERVQAAVLAQHVDACAHAASKWCSSPGLTPPLPPTGAAHQQHEPEDELEGFADAPAAAHAVDRWLVRGVCCKPACWG